MTNPCALVDGDRRELLRGRVADPQTDRGQAEQLLVLLAATGAVSRGVLGLLAGQTHAQEP
jgi:hypothetical protein